MPRFGWLSLFCLYAACLACGGNEVVHDAGTRPLSDASRDDAARRPLTDGGGDDAARDASSSGDNWSTFAEGFFATYCTRCHNDHPTHLRNFQTIADVRRDAAIIRCGIGPGIPDGCTPDVALPETFPVGEGPYPTADERQRLVAWIDAGLPE